MDDRYVDAVVVGSGPNGLSAAITMARAGLSVAVLEAAGTAGGGLRSAELTLPGFIHDICAAIHPLALGSPFLSCLPLAEHGLQMIQPAIPAAHPLDDGRTVVLRRSVDETAGNLGADAGSYRWLMEPLVRSAPHLLDQFLGPLRLPRHPLSAVRFGRNALRSATGLASRFQTEQARALLAGLSAHAVLPLTQPATAGFGLILGMLAHAVGWPVAKGGSQKIAEALSSYLLSLGGCILTGRRIDRLEDLPPHRAVLLDIGPRELIRIAGDRLPATYRHLLRRYRYGPGVFKLDWALDGAVPWKDRLCRQAGTVHLGGTLEQIAAAEQAVWSGRHPERPYCIIAQCSVADPTRAPEGKSSLWGYCHVPAGSGIDMTGPVEDQIERCAPGFKDRILSRHAMSPADLERHNSNYVGGDINGGVQDLRQLFTRPVPRLDPYVTPLRGVYLCSSSTAPGGGAHGMCGYFAARSALRREFAHSS